MLTCDTKTLTKWRLEEEDGVIVVTTALLPAVDSVVQRPASFRWAFQNCSWPYCRFWWLHGLRRGSAAARLLGLRVRTPLGSWLSICFEYCVLLGGGLCAGPIPRLEEACRECVCVSLSVIRCNNNPQHLR